MGRLCGNPSDFSRVQTKPAANCAELFSFGKLLPQTAAPGSGELPHFCANFPEHGFPEGSRDQPVVSEVVLEPLPVCFQKDRPVGALALSMKYLLPVAKDM